MENAEIGAAVIGITEVTKRLFGLPRKYCPVFAILVGVILAVLSEITHGNSPAGILGFFSAYFWALIRGIVIGTTATGLYTVGDNFVDKANTKSKQRTTNN